MNNEAFGAEFGALTDEEQVMVLGGDGVFAYAVGFSMGFCYRWGEAALVIAQAANPFPSGKIDYAYLSSF